MKLKKRKKSVRMRGSKTCGYAAKKHRGKGSKGGKGMAGTGKKAGQKKTFIMRYMPGYLGKKSLKPKKTKLKKINLNDIENNINTLISKKIAKEGTNGIEITLPGYKILGDGELKTKMIINATCFSKQAKEKIEKIGGKAVVLNSK